MIDQGRKNVLGVAVSVVDYQAAVNKIAESARRHEPLAISATAVHGLMTAVKDPEHRHRLNNLEMIVPDGQPIRWALNFLHGAGLKDRVYGPDLMLKTCAMAQEQSLGVFLFGGTDELLQALADNLSTKFPSLHIAGVQASKFRTVNEAEKNELIETILSSGADIVMVGLGCPRQEVWAYEFKDHLNMPVLAIGAAFNFHAGLLDQSPALLQRYAMEWAYRLYKEPARLWRRYLLLNPQYLVMVFWQKFGLGKTKFSLDSARRPEREISYG